MSYISSMQNFENRRDRFELFNSMESPLLNITFKLTVPDFREYCKSSGHQPFHFFLYTIFKSLMQVENFRYRIYKNEVIKIDRLIPSYTVMNHHQVLNFTRFEHSDDISTFIKRSLEAKEYSSNSTELLNSATQYTERDLKDSVFVTSIPWLDFTQIQHPVYAFKSADIPSVAWGKWTENNGNLTLPFSVQVHHGFVDGYHIHLLSEEIGHQIKTLISK